MGGTSTPKDVGRRGFDSTHRESRDCSTRAMMRSTIGVCLVGAVRDFPGGHSTSRLPTRTDLIDVLAGAFVAVGCATVRELLSGFREVEDSGRAVGGRSENSTVLHSTSRAAFVRARRPTASGICRCFWTVPVRGQSGLRGRRDVLGTMHGRMGDVGDPPTTGDGGRRIVHIRR